MWVSWLYLKSKFSEGKMQRPLSSGQMGQLIFCLISPALLRMAFSKNIPLPSQSVSIFRNLNVFPCNFRQNVERGVCDMLIGVYSGHCCHCSSSPWSLFILALTLHSNYNVITIKKGLIVNKHTCDCRNEELYFHVKVMKGSSQSFYLFVHVIFYIPTYSCSECAK